MPGKRTGLTPERRWHRNHLLRYNKMRLADYDKLVIEQCGRCAICGSDCVDARASGRLCVDHNHKTGVVRGLLCVSCNAGLGQFKDDKGLLASAIKYLIEKEDK